MCQEADGQNFTALTDQRMKDAGEMQAEKKQDDTAYFTVMSATSVPKPNRTDLEKFKGGTEAQISTPASQTTLLVHKDNFRVDERIAECNFNKRSKDKLDVAKAVSTDSTRKSETDTVDVTGRLSPSVHEIGQQSNKISQDKSTLGLEMSHKETYIMENNLTQNKTSDLVINRFVENMQEFAEGSVRHNNCKVETESRFENKDSSIKTKMDDGTEKIYEKQDKTTERRMGDETTEHITDNKTQCTNLISDQGIAKKQPDTEGQETTLSEKTKTYVQVQAERQTSESRDQSVVSPIIILPDTRETIKNVAKMRAMPVTPEIKVTVPEKVKCEESFSVPKVDVLLSEPERVTYPHVHEVSLMPRDAEPFSEEQRGVASRAPNKHTRDDRVIITAEPLDGAPPQCEKIIDRVPSDQRTIVSKPENVEAQTGDREEPSRVSSGWSRRNESNNIPIISIACADDIASFQEQETEYKMAVFHDSVHRKTDTESAAPKMQDNSSLFTLTTHAGSSTENSIKQEVVPEALTVIAGEVKGHSDRSAGHKTNQVVENAAMQEEGTERRNIVEIQPSSDISSSKALQNTTACDTEVCPKVEPDADRFQRDKPAMEKLGLTAPVGPTLPPLSPASLRRLMAKNNPNMESQGSTVTILGDGNEKKGEDSGCSTPTSTLSCESSPKMKRRDSLTLIPSATPEELASGARRKIYLAKTKSEDEGLETQSKRDSPYLSPSQARRAAFLQLQSGQQSQQMEKRSPLLGRRKTLVEMHKPKEEPSEETNVSSTDNTQPAEKEKLDPYKGNK